MKRKLCAALVVLAACSAAGWAAVLTGPIVHLPESGGMFWWGDGIHNLGHEWSVNNPNFSGWFYGSSYGWSTADVYVYSGLTDPTTVSDATVFPYTNTVLWAQEGDSVFFRGTNGYYGAWRIDDIYPGSPAYAYLDGGWYFVDDATGNFTPEPSALSLMAIGLLALRRR